MQSSHRIIKALIVITGFGAGLFGAAAVRPQQVLATDCGEPEATTTELESLDVPEADREFWESHTIDIYSATFWAVDGSTAERTGYWEMQRTGDLEEANP